MHISSTPLSKKLGLKSGFRIALIGAPKDYFKLLKFDTSEIDLVEFLKPKTLDYIHIFCLTHKEMVAKILSYKPCLKMNGMIWVSWPKGKSKINTDLNRDLIRESILEMGLVDVKIASFDKDWSSLKFVYRLKDRS